MTHATLCSWGRFPDYPQRPIPCYWRRQLTAELSRFARSGRTTLPFGLGRSYGDSCLASSDQVLAMRPLDHFISADWKTGLIRAEAGVTLGEIISVALPRGWFLPVTPGTQHVTLGGAIANDVHGKNHHRRGTFGRHVRCFSLVRSDRGNTLCGPQVNADLFEASIGGLGLTGVIEWAEIQLTPVHSSRIDVVSQRFHDLDEFFALSDELDARHEFCVSWIDCAAKGARMGRGIYIAGDFAQDGPLRLETQHRLNIPGTPPVSLINGMSLYTFNALYWHKAPARRCYDRTGYDSFFYPLDAIGNWNRIYGPKGFQQYQAMIPEQFAREGILDMLAAIAAADTGSFLAVLKRTGDLRSPGLLSFPRAGTTLALDFPHAADLTHIFKRLDAIVREAGGRLYPAKDAHMSADDFQRGYPAWQQVEALRDPVLQSRFWQRVSQ